MVTAIYVLALALSLISVFFKRGIVGVCVFYATYGLATVIQHDEVPTVAGITVYRYLYICLAISLIVALCRPGSVLRFRSAVPVAYGAVILVVLGSSIVSPYVVLLPLEHPQSLAARLMIYGLLLLCSLQVSDDIDVAAFAWTAVIVGLALSVYTIQTAETFRFMAARAGVVVNQNYVAEFVAIGVLATLYLMFGGKALAISLFAPLAAQVYGLFLLASRGAVVACVAGMICLFFFRARSAMLKRVLISFGCMLIVSVLVLAAPGTEEVLLRFSDYGDVQTLNSRTIIWNAVMHDFGQDPVHFVVGEGFLASADYVNRRTALVGNVHSVYLEWLLELGVVGLAVFIWLQFTIWKGIRLIDRPHVILLMAWFVFLAVEGLQGTVTDDHTFWIVSGVMLGASVEAKMRAAAGRRSLQRSATAVAAGMPYARAVADGGLPLTRWPGDVVGSAKR